jgi:twitching motility protein PilT
MLIADMLKFGIEKNASDLHLSDGCIPKIRVDGDLIDLTQPSFQHHSVMTLLNPALNPTQLEQLENTLEFDLSLIMPGVGRFRVNVYKYDRGMSAALRIIPPHVLTIEDLGLPPITKEIANLPNGLVLFTGPTGSGKSTSLAAIIHYINTQRKMHIITIEDPIEYVHENINCIIHQREVYRDTKSFQHALRAALREDPDIILVGELRDLESVSLALTAAETGHLVFGTLHTSSAAKAIDRLIDIFPSGDEKNLIQSMLSESLRAVVYQTLLKKVNGGRVAAQEILLCTPAVRNLIREGKIANIYSAIQTGASVGMQTLDQNLKTLLNENIITKETAIGIANSKELFD